MELWKQYEPMIQAVVDLFHPFAEAAVHDLKRGKIVALYHNLSRRKIGDPSPLKELGIETKDFPDHFPPYFKKNWDGSPLKCTSITIRDKKGKAVGLICINVDTSFFQSGMRYLEAFLKTKADAANPIEIFGAPCEEQVNEVMEKFLKTHQLAQNHLTREQKKAIVQLLYSKGIFNFKNAVPFIAQKLSISRASVYNHIKGIL